MLAQTYSPVIGGEERMVEDLSGELTRRGHEVTVATLRQPQGEPAPSPDGVQIRLLGTSVHSIPGIPVHEERRYAAPAPDPKTTAELKRVIAEVKPDVIHAHNWIVNSYLPLARGSSTPLVLSLHDYGLVCATKRLFYRGEVCSGPGFRKCLEHSFEYYGHAKGTMVAAGTRFSEPWLHRQVDMFISISNAVEELSRVGDHRAHRVIPEMVAPLPPAPPDVDATLSFLPDEPYVLFFGDVGEDKGARHLIDTYRTLHDPPPLVLIGRHRMDGLDGDPRIIAPGPMPHPAAIEAVRRSMFTVAPSVWIEPFGIVGIETAAAGKPIVASDVGGLHDIVLPGETGLLVPPGDVPALRAALEQLIGDPKLCERMGAAASRRAAAFGPDAIVPQFEEAYGEVLTR